MSVFIGYPSFMAYQMMKGKKGNNDGFPSIPGMIARYSALGLTNEQMATNPVWVDKTGNGHDLQLKNLAWGGMSGVGGYEMNFNLWRNNVSGIPDISMSTTTTSVSVSVGNSTYNNNLIYIHISNWDINKNHWLKVTSTYEDGDLAFIFYNKGNAKKIGLPANGYVNILAYPEFKGNFMYISTTSNKQGSFTIEQLPLYPGALVFDGVDDYGVCENFPILTKEKGYTVIALRQRISMGEGISGLVSNAKNWFKDGAFILEYSYTKNSYFNRPVSFGAIGGEKDLPHILTYQTSKSYNGVSIVVGSFIGTDQLYVGKINNIIENCTNAAIWELVILDHDATEEELTKIKDYFVKTYPWLFFDQAWTVVGKTNEDEDRTTIANITGNGNNLVLSNFGFIEGSGYNEEGEYAGYLVTDGVDDKAVSKQFKFGKNFTVILDFKFPVKKISYCGFDLSSKVRIQSLQGSGVYVVLKGNRTLIPSNVVRAVTSEGKVYDENWNEYNIVPGNISSNYTMVNLGFDGSNQFAESATKLAGIYSSTLSKDDCIKAYNYLQTLKAK